MELPVTGVATGAAGDGVAVISEVRGLERCVGAAGVEAAAGAGVDGA